MRLNLTTDYAIRILILLATEEEGLHSVAAVSRSYAIPHSTVMKIVSDLVRLGFVQSLRGRSGGIRLARPADQIVLGDVIVAMEESFQLADCGSCILRPRCTLTGIFHEAVDAFLNVLMKYTLADLMLDRRSLTALLGLAEPPA